MSKRRTHCPEFKARVTMEAISGRKTLQEIAGDGAGHLIRVSQWMGQLLDGASEFPRRRRSPSPLRQRCNGLGGNRYRWLTTEVAPAPS
jgi:transposase-like protein